MVLRTDLVLTTVVVNWNTREFLLRCLEALIEGTSATQEIWVVDNASTDDSAAMVRREFPNVHLIVAQFNGGFAAANNLALRAAHPSRYVLLLNPDTEVSSGALDALVTYLDRNPHVGAAGVQLLNPDGTKQRSYDHFYSFVASFRRNLLVDMVLRRTRGIVTESDADAVPVDWLIGACVMLRAEALAQIGVLDESFFMYGEEVDLQRRLHNAGWSVMLLPHVHIVHHGGASSKQASLRMMIEEYHSRYLLIRKHSPRAEVIAYLGKAVIGLCVWSTYWAARSLAPGSAHARYRARAYRAVLQSHLRPTFYSRSAGT